MNDNHSEKLVWGRHPNQHNTFTLILGTVCALGLLAVFAYDYFYL